MSAPLLDTDGKIEKAFRVPRKYKKAIASEVSDLILLRVVEKTGVFALPSGVRKQTWLEISTAVSKQGPTRVVKYCSDRVRKLMREYRVSERKDLPTGSATAPSLSESDRIMDALCLDEDKAKSMSETEKAAAALDAALNADLVAVALKKFKPKRKPGTTEDDDVQNEEDDGHDSLVFRRLRAERNAVDMDFQEELDREGERQPDGSAFSEDDRIPGVMRTPKKQAKPVKLRTPRSTPKRSACVRKFKKFEPDSSLFEKKLAADAAARAVDVEEREKDRKIRIMELELERERLAMTRNVMETERVDRKEKEKRDEERYREDKADQREIIRLLMNRVS